LPSAPTHFLVVILLTEIDAAISGKAVVVVVAAVAVCARGSSR
jgi:hypothetical protein